MVEEIGRINRPAAANYDGKRRLLLARWFSRQRRRNTCPPKAPRWWAVTGSRWTPKSELFKTPWVASPMFTTKICRKEESRALATWRQLGRAATPWLRALTHAGAALENTESIEILAESLDLQRFLMGPIMSQTVATRVQEWLIEATRRRYAHIAEVIDSTLGDDETGLLLINERHQVQFPSDIEVIYVAPPALDEFRRWLQNWTQQMQSAASTEDHSEDDDSDDDQSDGEDPTQDPGDDEPEP